MLGNSTMKKFQFFVHFLLLAILFLSASTDSKSIGKAKAGKNKKIKEPAKPAKQFMIDIPMIQIDSKAPVSDLPESVSGHQGPGYVDDGVLEQEPKVDIIELVNGEVLYRSDAFRQTEPIPSKNLAKSNTIKDKLSLAVQKAQNHVSNIWNSMTEQVKSLGPDFQKFLQQDKKSFLDSINASDNAFEPFDLLPAGSFENDEDNQNQKNYEIEPIVSLKTAFTKKVDELEKTFKETKNNNSPTAEFLTLEGMSSSYPSPIAETNIDLPNDCHLSGKPIITDYNYMADGNYKLQIEFAMNQKVMFQDLLVGKCNILNPGLEVKNENSKFPRLIVDLEKCHEEDDDNNHDDRDDAKSRGTFDTINKPISVTFDLVEKYDIQQPKKVLAKYQFFPSVNYAEDYIVEFSTESNIVESLLIDNSGQAKSQSGNIQFGFETLDTKNNNPQSKQKPKNLQLKPNNGFNVNIFTNLVEACYVQDLTKNDALVKIFDMNDSSENTNTKCYQNLSYDEKFGIWDFPVDFYGVFGNNDASSNHNNFKISCSVRVCENIPGNECAEIINNCGYSKLKGAAAKFPLQPFENENL